MRQIPFCPSLFPAALGVAALTSAHISPAAEAQAPEHRAKAPPACPIDAPVGMGFYPRTARQGATLGISASEDHGPAGGIAVDLERFTDWQVSPANAATLSSNRSAITIAPNAPVGETLTVSAEICGERIAATARLVGREEKVLTGTWKQKEISCSDDRTPSDPVRELRFTDRNRFAVTYYPFETYEDYWGEVTADLDKGTIRMTANGGNFKPPGLDLEGGASLENQTLVLTDIFLGDRQKEVVGTCRYVFEPTGKLG